MKRAVTVPPAARSAFVVALKRESRHAAALPDPLPMARVLRIVDKASNSTDELKVLAEKKRILEHNTRVTEILRAKGFK